MNRILFLGALASLLMCSCKELSVSPSNQNVGSEAGSTTFNVSANIDWAVTDDADWITVSPSSGSDNGTLTATYTENKNTALQIANITVSGSGKSQLVTVTQAGVSESIVDITWTPKANLPVKRGWLSPSASVVNGKIYVIGGIGGEAATMLDAVDEYDPATNTWTSKSHLPTARWGCSSDTVDGKIYVMGGCATFQGVALASLEIYDPVLDKWETGSNMPTGRIGFGSCVVNGKIYAIGGRDADPGGNFLVTMDVYDPSTDTWGALRSLPSPRGYIAATAVNNKIYVMGGTATSPVPEKTVFKYDIASDTWSETSNMHFAKWGLSSCRVDNMIVVLGGFISGTDSGQNTVEIISTTNGDILKATSMVFDRGVCSVCEFDGKIWVFGGSTNPAIYSVTNSVEAGVIILK